MGRFSIQVVCLAVMVAGLFGLIAPDSLKDFLGIDSGASELVVRVWAGVATLLAFIVFSALSSGSRQPDDGPPAVAVDHLVARVKHDRPDLAGRLESEEALKAILQYLSVKRKIAAIKVARASVGGLKEAKELVETIAASVKTEQQRA